MLKVLLFSLVTTSLAFTTHRYDVYENFGNYRPIVPVMDNVFAFGNGNQRRPVQTYEYPRRYDGVVISDVFNQGPQLNSDDVHRRVDAQYSYQYPYQWSNRQVPWNRVAVTEPTNRFGNSNQDRNHESAYNTYPYYRQPIVQRDKEQVKNQVKGTKELNKTEVNVNVSQISTRSDDVNRTLVINEQQITWNNDHQSSNEDNTNIITRSINSDNNYTNSLHNGPSKQDKNDHPTKTNNRTVNRNQTNKFKENTNINANNNNDSIRPNNTVNGVDNSRKTNDEYGTKTTQDNEVTPRTHEETTEKGVENDRWVWINAEGQNMKVETTTLFDLGDRAAFSGDGCPVGKVKVGGTCVVPD